jgi:predicted secreted Zn-dependent protease
MRLFRQSYSYTSALPAGYAKQTSLRPAIVTAAVSCLLLFSLLRAFSVYDMAAKQQSYTPVAKVTSTTANAGTPTPTPPAAGASAAPAVTTVKSSVNATPAAPNCAPDTAYTGPASLSLGGAAAGLTTQIDPTHYYQVYGYTNTQIRQQINACAPKLSGNDDFTGYTTYRLSWQYRYSGNADGTCSLVAPKIGMHIGEVLPSWQASAYATPGLATKWSAFIAGLDTHEHGHITLDQQYAAQILASLQAMPATDCGTIAAQANAIINNGVAALDAANVNYDTQTNHGATQGAILP